MNRTRRPSLETLESKTLLSTIAGDTAPIPQHVGSALVDKPVTPRAPHAPGLKFTLATSQSVYQQGETVVMTMTITDKSNHTVTTAVGPSIDVFVVSSKGKVVWRSDDHFTPLYIARLTLHPGESHVITASWKAAATGTFVVHNTALPHGRGAHFRVVASSIARSE